MTFIVMFHGAPTAAAPDLATAQEHALAERTAPASASPYENGWVEKGPGEWRLMTRRRAGGGRWSWTQRAVRAVPLIHGEQPAPADRAAVLREAADRLSMDWGGPDHADGMDEARQQLRRMADEAQQTTPVCICGHVEQQHFEDVCQTCGCGYYLEPQDAADVIDRWQQEAVKLRVARGPIVYPPIAEDLPAKPDPQTEAQQAAPAVAEEPGR
ncbi:hypothetical protein ACFV1C_00350 [Streptomyces sp. NPDC059605]|uniref:hypothetical protein n=1 Tax=Streptomyces sp. NPDC059605 TaxID=3346882 RepID=UPI0036C3ED02